MTREAGNQRLPEGSSFPDSSNQRDIPSTPSSLDMSDAVASRLRSASRDLLSEEAAAAASAAVEGEGGRQLYSDLDYNFLVLQEDPEDYLLSSSSTVSSSVSPAVASLLNGSMLAIDSEFDHKNVVLLPSLNFSSVDGFFSLAPPSDPDNISLPFDPRDAISGLEEQPDLSIHHPFLAVVLGVLCLAVVAGNILVMVAVRRERNLQTVTNYFVSSLAAADCLVGLVVMPFSVVHEVMNKSWIFGQDLCDLWHSFDVLATTASILNLCVISMDRYWAITDPLSYPAKLTSRRAKVLIAIVWLSSSLISFPAIAWWRAVSTSASPEYQCTFTEDIGYLVFSSIISFYGPLSVMIFVYYRIYRAAIEQTRSIEKGSKNVCMHSLYQSSDPRASDRENGPVVLRIHRGGSTPTNQTIEQAKRQQEEQRQEERRIGRRKKRAGKRAAVVFIIDPDDEETRAGGGHSSDDSSPPAASQTEEAAARAQRNLKAMGKRFTKLAKERKAAKTLGNSPNLHSLPPTLAIRILFTRGKRVLLSLLLSLSVCLRGTTLLRPPTKASSWVSSSFVGCRSS